MTEVGDVFADLQHPQAFGAGAGSTVTTFATHASWVFIVGDDVWKVKRPVDFGFLDFRTADARRHFCEEEVRLNRRLAPGVYLGVEPVRRGPNGHNIGGDGPVVDWAVHMRRLPDDASASALLARGALDRDALARLADVLAAFLASAPATPQLGTLEVVHANVAENFAQVAPLVGGLVDQDTFAEARAFQTGLLQQHPELFRARVAEQRIRDGHGDLRLEHVYFVPGEDGASQPLVIDCIEFNERFRCGDAAAEVAFLAMELEAARRPDLAAGFLARFAEASNDFGLYGVLDFYLSYRAWVRGKVAAFVAADAAAGAALRAHKRAEAMRHFALARSFAGRPLDRPFVVAVGGIIGTGKSTLAAALGRELAAPVISSDRVRKALAGLGPTDRGDASLYEPANIERVYAELVRGATGVVGSRHSVILDATFSERRWRDAVARLAGEAGAGFAFVETRCADTQVLRRRLAERRHAASVSDATDEQLAQSERRFEPVAAGDAGPSLAIDTGGAPEDAVAEALRGLQRIGIVAARDRRAS